MTQPASDNSSMKIRLHLRTDNHIIMKKISSTQPAAGDPTIQIRPYDYKTNLVDSTCIRWLKRLRSRTDDHMIMKKLSSTQPTPDASTMQIRFHVRTDDHMIMKQLSLTHHASDVSTKQKRFHLGTDDQMILKNSPWLNLHPMTQLCKYDFTVDYETTLLDSTCIRWLNHANTT